MIRKTSAAGACELLSVRIPGIFGNFGKAAVFWAMFSATLIMNLTDVSKR